MKDCNLFQLYNTGKWFEVRKYLSSDAAEEEKKSNIMYCHHYGRTCLNIAQLDGAPDDVIKAMVDIGGKDLVMMIDKEDCTALHFACRVGASYYIMRMLIEVGGKDLIMAKSSGGDTALHRLCCFIKTHTEVAEKINLILQVGGANLLLSTQNLRGETPLTIASEGGTSKEIKKLLTVQSTTSVADMQMEAARAQELLEESNRRAADLDATVETQRLEIADLSSNIIKKLLTVVQSTTSVSDMQMEAARAQDLLEESNRRAADLEATVETQKSEIADLSNEKDDIEKECMDKIDKLTRKLSKQQAELQQLKKSSTDLEVGMKRKHTNEEHEEGKGVEAQSQTQSSKRRRVGIDRHADDSVFREFVNSPEHDETSDGETKKEREFARESEDDESSAGDEVHNDTFESDILAESRAMFQELAVQSKTKHKTLAEVNNIIEVLTNWNNGDSEYPLVAEYRNANKVGYYWKTKYEVQSKVLENKHVHELHELNPIHGSRIVPIEEVFDVILHCHVDAAVHQKVRRTHNLVKKTYANISEKQVEIFIKNSCSVCNMKSKPKKSVKGAADL
eukprot:scaffold691_cov248-Chaetoceros_neogracile.AAC.1